MTSDDADYDESAFQFLGVSVSQLGKQSSKQRFGANSEPFLPSWHRPDGEEVNREEEIRRETAYIMPRVGEYKNNLTALSQRYNLYFAGYGAEIYVYRPHGPGQILSREPVLILRLPQTPPAKARCHSFSGFINDVDHYINHIMIGDLGYEEILLCACHDGDVMAYHTRAIDSSIGDDTLNTFFFQNVGISAWGLSIHKQSRLIAVSSNFHEVTVFAFGLNSSPDVDYSGDFPLNPKPSPSRSLTRDEIPLGVDGHVDRSKNFKFVISLRPEGSNVPSIAFSDDDNGDAKNIIAKDVYGSLWLLPLRREDNQRLQTSPKALQGWGVLVLPVNFFTPTATYQETFGHPHVKSCPLDMDDISNVERLIDITGGMHCVIDGALNPVFLDETMQYYPSRVGIQALDFFRMEDMLDTVVRDVFEVHAGPRQVVFEQSLKACGGKFLVLHTDCHNVELLSYNGPSTVCRNIIRHDTRTATLTFANAGWDHHRLNMLAAIPALSLVVVGSQQGRVALLTITRHAPDSNDMTNFASFRIERTLPSFERDDRGRAVTPGESLLGMAVGPMQGEMERRKRGQNCSLQPARYRLMLHYFDHSILSYELSRNPVTQDLNIEIF